jgi:hypothetical protein
MAILRTEYGAPQELVKAVTGTGSRCQRFWLCSIRLTNKENGRQFSPGLGIAYTDTKSTKRRHEIDTLGAA